MDGLRDGLKHGWMEGWMDGWMDEWANGWIDSWELKGGWMDRWVAGGDVRPAGGSWRVIFVLVFLCLNPCSSVLIPSSLSLCHCHCAPLSGLVLMRGGYYILAVDGYRGWVLLGGCRYRLLGLHLHLQQQHYYEHCGVGSCFFFRQTVCR